MKKIILSGLLAGVVMLVVGMVVGILFGAVFPALKAEYENTSLFRPWSDPIMSIFFVAPFILGIILAWIWTKTKGLFHAEKNWKKGLNFGLVYWVVTIPGMIISYSSFPISLLVVLSWSITILVQALCAGLIYAKLNK